MSPTEQRASALAHANRIRVTNAATLRDIAARSYDEGVDVVIDVLRNSDATEPIGALSLYRLLTAPRHMGIAKVRKLLGVAQVMSGDRKLREVTQRQRDLIAHHLEDPSVLWPCSRRAA